MKQIAAPDTTSTMIVAEQADIALLTTQLVVLAGRVAALEAAAGIKPSVTPPSPAPPAPTPSFKIESATEVHPGAQTPPFEVSVIAPGMMNVEISILEGFLARGTPDSSGECLITVPADPRLLNGPETLHIQAWDTPAGAPNSMHYDATSLPVTIAGVAGPVAPPAVPAQPTSTAPVCGLPGWTLATEWSFGANGTFKTIADLTAVFAPAMPWGRINGEMQVYTDFNQNNLQIVNDELHLIATPTRGIGDQQIDSAELISKLSLAAPPSLLEICFKAPAGLGMWPACWRYGIFPTTGDASEIDDFEIVFNKADGTRDTTQGVFVNDHLANSAVVGTSLLDQWGKWHAPFDFAQGFHTMATRWQGDTIERWCDQTRLVTRTGNWTSSPPNVIINLACGSTAIDFPGQPNAASFENGANVLAIKFVRIWKPV